jgi:hypothetical protein
MNRRTFAKSAAAWSVFGIRALGRAASTENELRRRRLNCHWQERKRGTVRRIICDLTDGNDGPFDFTSLFIDGRQETLARFPDVDPSGTSIYVAGVRFFPSGILVPDFGEAIRIEDMVAIEFDAATFTQRRWGDPDLAVLCLKQNGPDLRMAIRTMDYDHNLIWCLRPKGQRDLKFEGIPRFYVENVYEETTAVHEWYLDRKLGYLYYCPADELDMSKAIVEVS